MAVIRQINLFKREIGICETLIEKSSARELTFRIRGVSLFKKVMKKGRDRYKEETTERLEEGLRKLDSLKS